MNVPTILGLIGAIIAGIAYLPQITHLIKEHCSAGISQNAFLLWFVASVLITTNAVYIRSGVFIFLGVVQIVSTLLIFIFSTIYRGQTCIAHITAAVKTNTPTKPN
jgi:uncharacterized protein with PQ loop repeat